MGVLQCNDSCFLCAYNSYFPPLTFVKFLLCISLSLCLSVSFLINFLSCSTFLLFHCFNPSIRLPSFLSPYFSLSLSFFLSPFLSILLVFFYLFPISFTLYTSSPSTFIMFWMVVQVEGQHSIVVPTFACLSVCLYIYIFSPMQMVRYALSLPLFLSYYMCFFLKQDWLRTVSRCCMLYAFFVIQPSRALQLFLSCVMWGATILLFEYWQVI